MPRVMASRCGSRPWSCIARGSGELVGWHASSMTNLSWIGFGQHTYRTLARGQLAHILQTLVCYRLIDPGSEWRLHRQWFEQSAMGDLLVEDYSLVAKNSLYRCLDKLLPHKAALFSHLRPRCQDLFGATFEILIYYLNSNYF